LFRKGQPVNRDYYAAILAGLSETVRKNRLHVAQQFVLP